MPGTWREDPTAMADVSDAASVYKYKMVEDGIQALGKIDILVST